MSWKTCCCCFLSTLLVHVVLGTNTSCPAWHYYNNATGQCECGHGLSCRNQVEIRNGYCATSSKQGSDYLFGECPFLNSFNIIDRMYSEMPSNTSQLDEVMCGPYNRRGLLCGECKDGYGPAVYSLDQKCAKCSSLWSGYAICLYLFFQFVPTTFIFICLVVSRLKITSGPLLGYVVFCQSTVAIPTYHYYFLYGYIHNHVALSLRLLLDSIVAVSEFWSLNFFKAIIPPFCISEKLTGIHVHVLNLIPAIYPFVLVIISCILMELHARKYRIVEILWKPFKIILNKTKITAVTSDAVFRAFASFIFLSNVSVMFASYQMVNFVKVYNSVGLIQSEVLYIDPTVEWTDSIPYTLTAVVFFTCITLIPSLLLCIYPTRVYRYLSRFLSARKRLAITAFAEALHSCFKDGLNGTRDYRALAGAPLLLSLLYILITNCLLIGNRSARYTSLDLFWMMLVCVVSYIKPCKSSVANISLVFHMTLFGILLCAANNGTHTLELTFIATLLTPHILVALWAGYTLTKHTLTRFGYQFHGPGCKEALSDMANGVRRCLSRRYRGYQELQEQ
jgi:hypothetical protein